jgi:hypothetical protein
MAAPPTSTPWVPIGPTQVPGGYPPAPGARVYRSTAQPIPNNAWQAVGFDTVRYDSGGTWAAANPTRLTCQVPGTYTITGHAVLANSAAGTVRLASLWLNGATALAQQAPSLAAFSGSITWRASVTTTTRLNAGDYVELWLYQDTGAALNTLAGSATEQDAADFEMVMAGGPPGVGVPTPVVNGQWIKGVGGAAVWQAITPADVGLPKVTTSAFSGAAPASPVAGDIWIATNVLGQNINWQFMWGGGGWWSIGASDCSWYFGGTTPTVPGWQAVPYGPAALTMPHTGNYIFTAAMSWYSNVAGTANTWEQHLMGPGTSVGSVSAYCFSDHKLQPLAANYWINHAGSAAWQISSGTTVVWSCYPGAIAYVPSGTYLGIRPTWVS